MNSPLVPPVLGVADNSSWFKQPGGTCPPLSMLNCRPYTTPDKRPQIGQRPGIVKAFPQQMGNGAPGQGCGVVSRSRAISGYRIGERTTIDGTGRSTKPAALLGQVWGIARNFAMFLRRYENVSAGGEFADTGPADQSVVAIRYSKDETKIIYASNYIPTATGRLEGRVTCIDAKSGAVLWSRVILRTIALVAQATFVNSLCCSNDYVWVCTNQFVRGLKLTDGTTFGVEFDCNGWAQECIQAVVTADDSALLIAFRGSTAGGTLNSGVVVGGPLKAGIWRSGVMKATIQPAGSGVALVATALGPQLPVGDRYYEGPVPYAPHNYVRFSEVLSGCGKDQDLSVRQPRGRWPTGIALLPDGGFVVSHTNSGYGPNSNALHTVPNGWPANDYSPPGPPYYTLSYFDSGGNYQRSIDTFSIVELKADGFYSDIPNDSSEVPSITALDISTDGTIFCGGRVQSAIPANAFAFDSFGNPKWAINLGQIIRENGVAVAKDDQQALFGGDRSTTWPSSGAADAILWKLQKDTGAVLNHFDLGSAVSCLGVTSNARGDIAFSSDKVP